MKLIPPLDEAITKLTSCLNAEKECLMAGTYAQLPKLSEQKAYFIGILDQYIAKAAFTAELRAHRVDINRIKKLALENEKLLASAKAGAASAKNRLTAIMNRESVVGTYTEHGDKLRTHDAVITRRKIA